ncbi:MAG: hypothetical protein ACAI44_22315 [Candidatus Sericytochromatia bacterium]
MRIGEPRIPISTIKSPEMATVAAQPIKTDDNVVSNKGGINVHDLEGAYRQAEGQKSIFIQTADGSQEFIEINLSDPANAQVIEGLLNDLKNGRPVEFDKALLPLFQDGTDTLKDAGRDRRDFKEMGISLRDGLNLDEAKQIFEKLTKEGATESEIQSVVDFVNKKIDRNDQKLSFSLDAESGCLNYTIDDQSETTVRERGHLKLEGKLDLDISGGSIHKVKDGHLHITGPKIEKTRDGVFDVGLDLKVEKGREREITLIKSSAEKFAERAEKIDFTQHFSTKEGCELPQLDEKSADALTKDLKKVGINLKNGVSSEEYVKLQEYLKTDVAASMPEGTSEEVINTRVEQLMKEIEQFHGFGINWEDCDPFRDQSSIKDNEGLKLKFWLPKVTADPHAEVQFAQYDVTGIKIDAALPEFEGTPITVTGEVPTLTWEPGTKETVSGTPESDTICPPDLNLTVTQDDIEPTSVQPDYGQPIQPFEKDLQGRYQHDQKTVMTGKNTDTPAEQVADYFGGLPGSVEVTIDANSNILNGEEYNKSLTEKRYQPFNGLTEASDTDKIHRGGAIGDLNHRNYIQETFGLEANGTGTAKSLKSEEHSVTSINPELASEAFTQAANGLFTLEVEKGQTVLQMNRDIVLEDGSLDPQAAKVIDDYLAKNEIKLTPDERQNLFEYAQSYMDYRSFNADIKVTLENEDQYQELKTWAEGKDLTGAAPEVIKAHEAIMSSLSAWEQNQSAMTAQVLSNFADNLDRFTAYSQTYAAGSVPEQAQQQFSAAFNQDIASIAAYPGETMHLEPAMAERLGLSPNTQYDKAAVLAAMEALKAAALDQ